MGYTTKFEGELRFTSDVTGSQLAFLRSLFWKSDRDEPGMWAEHSPDTDGGYFRSLTNHGSRANLRTSQLAHIRNARSDGLTSEGPQCYLRAFTVRKEPEPRGSGLRGLKGGSSGSSVPNTLRRCQWTVRYFGSWNRLHQWRCRLESALVVRRRCRSTRSTSIADGMGVMVDFSGSVRPITSR